MMRPLSAVMQALLLAVLTFAVYSPALHVPLNPVDDRELIQWLFDLGDTGFLELMAWSTGEYYRPVLLASYLLDMKLWGAATQVMHLENLLLHLLNVLLLFSCARILLPRNSWWPFLTALLFAFHPLNSEPVNWISGRSDLLACTFVLLAARQLFQGLKAGRPRDAYWSLLLLVPGVFSKETAVFFIPAALVIMVSSFEMAHNERHGLIDTVKQRWLFILPFFSLPFLYIGARLIQMLSQPAGLIPARQLISGGQADLVYNLKTALQGIGFYAKKLVVPWPLNFTIATVPEAYLWLGLLVVLLLVFLLWRRTLADGLILASACIGSSAILVMLLRPAWTPVAERYMYIPSAFFCLAVMVLLVRLSEGATGQKTTAGLVVLFVGVLAVSTYSRNLVWQDNITLFRDAAEKSPEFPFVKSVLADLLIESGQLDEGREIIMTNTAPEGLRNADFLDLKRAELLYNEGRLHDARRIIREKRRREGQLYFKFQELLAKVDAALLQKISGGPLHAEILEETVAVHLELKKATKDAFYSYRLGQIFMQLDDKGRAREYFQLTVDHAPDGVYYKEAAARLVERLSEP